MSQNQGKAVTILVLGILGITVCALLAPVAWSMGNSYMEVCAVEGNEPEGLAVAGRILGIVGTLFLGLGLVAFLFGMCASMAGWPSAMMCSVNSVGNLSRSHVMSCVIRNHTSRARRWLSASALVIGLLAAGYVDAAPAGYDVVFEDEFDANAIDTSLWRLRYPWGEAQINGELQAYTDDQFSISNGILSIVGEHEQAPYAGTTFDYASGVITSYHAQTFGYFEARVKCPEGQGLWPAFWLYAEMGSGRVDEIDILELLGHETDTAHMTLHWGDSYEPGHHNSEGSQYVGPDFSADFHTFGVEWTADRVAWFIDDIERFSYEGAGVPQGNLYLIANLAIGGNWPGAPDASTVFPAYYEIDYIRAYTKSSDPPDGGAGGAAGSGSGGVGGSSSGGASGSSSGGASGSSGGAGVDGGSVGGGGSPATGGSAGSPSATPAPPEDSSSGCACRLGSLSPKNGVFGAASLVMILAVCGIRRRGG